MPEHLRALAVILVLSGVVFYMAQRPLAPLMTGGEDTYKRRRNLWIAVVLAAFLAHNFWVYVAVCAGLLVSRLGRDEAPLSVYCLLLLAVPGLDKEVPGFGLINYVFNLNHVRLLNLVLLLPVAIRIMGSQDERPANLKLPDLMVASYLVLMFLLQARVDSVTGIMRSTFYLVVDVWLPYFVASRSLRSLQSFRDVVSSLVLGAVVLCPIAMFEMLRGWLLYDSLGNALGLPPHPFGMYLTRGEGGLLRSNATVGNAIVLGYVMMVALALYLFLQPRVEPRWKAHAALACLVGGLVAALSRGPWVGAAVAFVVTLCLGPGGGKRMAQLVGAGAVGFGLLMLTPYGASLLDYLPFVGTVDEGNVVYRQRLFELSMMVMWQNPVFGAFDYVFSPLLEEMRTGLGIIDIVNSYIAVALGYGLVGLAFFVSPFLACLWWTWRARRKMRDAGHFEAERLGRVLIGCMLGILVTIATVSSIGVVPTLYWLVLGFCVAYVRAFGFAEMAHPRVVVASPDPFAFRSGRPSAMRNRWERHRQQGFGRHP